MMQVTLTETEIERICGYVELPIRILRTIVRSKYVAPGTDVSYWLRGTLIKAAIIEHERFISDDYRSEH